jgi:hypothetical protein
MVKTKLILKEGMLVSIKLNENNWTLGQLCNVFKLENKRYEQYTFAFFNYLFLTEQELKNSIDILDLNVPIIILTINGNPIKNYGLNLIGIREIDYHSIPDYKDNISQTLGLYKDRSSDFDHILSTYFGLYPWDGFYKEDYVDNVLTPNAPKRKDIKYMKDYSIEALKKIMPPNSVKLKQILENK